MRELLLVRFGEVHLKGQNRPFFLRFFLPAFASKAIEEAGNADNGSDTQKNQ